MWIFLKLKARKWAGWKFQPPCSKFEAVSRSRGHARSNVPWNAKRPNFSFHQNFASCRVCFCSAKKGGVDLSRPHSRFVPANIKFIQWDTAGKLIREKGGPILPFNNATAHTFQYVKYWGSYYHLRSRSPTNSVIADASASVAPFQPENSATFAPRNDENETHTDKNASLHRDHAVTCI